MIVRKLGSLDARASDSGRTLTRRSTVRLPCLTVGNFSLTVGGGLKICGEQEEIRKTKRKVKL